jgi:hypothetical protein
VLIATAKLAVIALLAFALSFVAFLVQTSRHRPSGGWAAAAGVAGTGLSLRRPRQCASG